MVATLYNNIAVVYDKLKDFEQSKKYHYKALDLRLKIFGNQHPNVAYSYNKLGLIHYNLGYNEMALDFFNAALDIRKKVYFKNHKWRKETEKKIIEIRTKMTESHEVRLNQD